jgi:hypothetical protein
MGYGAFVLDIAKRITAILTIASAISCIAFLILLPASHWLKLPFYAHNGNDIEPHASLSIGTFHCGLSRGALWFFNDDLPYTGSIIGLEGTWAGKRTTDRTDWRWVVYRYGIEQVSHIDDKGQCAGKERACDVPGLYYRYFDWWNQKDSLWTLALSLWYPIALSTVLPSFWLIQHLRRRNGFRFSLRTLLIATTLLALVLGLLACYMHW